MVSLGFPGVILCELQRPAHTTFWLAHLSGPRPSGLPPSLGLVPPPSWSHSFSFFFGHSRAKCPTSCDESHSVMEEHDRMTFEPWIAFRMHQSVSTSVVECRHTLVRKLQSSPRQRPTWAKPLWASPFNQFRPAPPQAMPLWANAALGQIGHTCSGKTCLGQTGGGGAECFLVIVGRRDACDLRTFPEVVNRVETTHNTQHKNTKPQKKTHKYTETHNNTQKQQKPQKTHKKHENHKKT